jgi:hypothetical protein
MSAKSADIWLSGRHVADMLPTFPVKTTTGVIQPKTHLLDNKAAAELKAEIKKNCKIQLVPPTTTDETWRREQYKHSKITSRQY